jgi:hypothetical protein
MKMFNINKLFFFKDIDSRYVIYLCGIRFLIKHKPNIKFKQTTEFGLNKEPRNPQVIVSLTSYPARINTVHITINTLLQQSLKPDKVILWLAEEQFPKKEKDLPQELIKLKAFGLDIEWCDDIKSFKKLVPAIEKYPNDIIVTADDDVYYQSNMLESLYNAYKTNPKNIYVKRSVKLEMKNNYPTGISSRKYMYKHLTEPSYFNQLMGGSGCLYPPHSLYKDCTNIDIIRNTIPTHDDAYFWSMAILNRTKIQVVGGFNENLYFVDGTQDVGLIHTNKKGGQGISLEDAYKIMIKKYPNLLNILKGI